MVQTKVAVLPASVAEELKLETEASSALPSLTVHKPLSPSAGTLAVIVNVELLQLFWAGPAADTEGTTLLSVTMEVLLQLPRVMVQRSTAGLLVTVAEDVREPALATFAAPLTTDQVPVSPETGALAARVKILLLHWV
jgi:hypothetical protein